MQKLRNWLRRQRRKRGGLSPAGVSPWQGGGVSRCSGATLPPTAEGVHGGSPPGPKAGLPAMVPESCWQPGSARCQAGNLPLPGESLPGHFIAFLRTARSLITSLHLPQMLHIPAMLRKCAEPCSISSKRARRLPPQGLAASRHGPRAKGKGTALLPRMSLQRRQQVTQPCPSPVSAGPRVAAGALRAGRLDCTQPKFRQTEGRGEMVSDPAAPRPLWPPLGFTLNRSQREGCCWDRCPCGNRLAAGYASWGVLYSQKSK